jgi:hypothetical protein
MAVDIKTVGGANATPKLNAIVRHINSEGAKKLEDYDLKKKYEHDFDPYISPMKMLELGVFEGKYLNDLYKKLPKEMFEGAVKRGKICPDGAPNASLNYFGIKSRMPLSEWKTRGWIMSDKKGWFEWYVHYFLGRRLGKEDEIQIGRWKKFARHYAQVVKNCKHKKNAKGQCSDPKNCRPKQRQALLQWAWPFLD